MDSDLLVPAAQLRLAEDRLLAIGFSKRLDSADQPPHSRHAHTWMRHSNRAAVDLHWTLDGVDASSEDLWLELSGGVEQTWVAGAEVDSLGPSARAFHAALHAAQHGPRNTKSLEDLRRALAQCDEATWVEAADLAARLGARSAFGTGLRMLLAGSQLASRLRVPENRSLTVALRADVRPPRMTLGMQHLLETEGARRRLKILWRAVWPSAQFMRLVSPLARKGRRGLALARLCRPVWLVLRAPRALVTIRAARRRIGGQAGGPS